MISRLRLSPCSIAKAMAIWGPLNECDPDSRSFARNPRCLANSSLLCLHRLGGGLSGQAVAVLLVTRLQSKGGLNIVPRNPQAIAGNGRLQPWQFCIMATWFL
jgi:hypothetical protein